MIPVPVSSGTSMRIWTARRKISLRPRIKKDLPFHVSIAYGKCEQEPTGTRMASWKERIGLKAISF